LADHRFFLAVAAAQVSRRHYRKDEAALLDAPLHFFQECRLRAEVPLIDRKAETSRFQLWEELPGKLAVRLLVAIAEKSIVCERTGRLVAAGRRRLSWRLGLRPSQAVIPFLPERPDALVKDRLARGGLADADVVLVERDGRLAEDVGVGAGRVHDQDLPDCPPLAITAAQKAVHVLEDQEPMVQLTQACLVRRQLANLLVGPEHEPGKVGERGDVGPTVRGADEN